MILCYKRTHPSQIQLVKSTIYPLFHIQAPLEFLSVIFYGDSCLSLLHAQSSFSAGTSARWVDLIVTTPPHPIRSHLQTDPLDGHLHTNNCSRVWRRRCAPPTPPECAGPRGPSAARLLPYSRSRGLKTTRGPQGGATVLGKIVCVKQTNKQTKSFLCHKFIFFYKQLATSPC